jgi:putative hydrolase of the HAD superfamily
MLRAICFDLDDTFWAVQPVLARAEARMMAFLEAEHPGFAASFTLDDLFALRRQLAQEAPDRAHHMTWLRTEALRRMALARGHDEGVGEAAFAVFREARSEVELFADVLPALTALQQRFVLGTLSNGNADLARIGLAGHFRAVLNAEILGVAKPKPFAFEAAAAALGVHPTEMLYVGDDPHIDVDGAQAVGCQAAWINRHGREWPAEIARPPEWTISSLSDLVNAVGRS